MFARSSAARTPDRREGENSGGRAEDVSGDCPQRSMREDSEVGSEDVLAVLLFKRQSHTTLISDRCLRQTQQCRIGRKRYLRIGKQI